MKPNNKSNHTDFHSGKRMLVKGKMRKDRDLDSFDFNVSDEQVVTTNWLSENDWSNKKRLRFSKSTVEKHLSKYKKLGVRRLYRGIDKRFVDDPELFRKYLESILKCTL